MPELLLQETSPYRTRRASLIRGADDTYLYLEDVTGPSPRTVSAVWVGNGSPAPTASSEPIEPGAPARMLARGARHPEGCPPINSPRLVWFEEGDGVALVDEGGVVAVIPGWGGVDGFYGYSRWAVGRSPLAWELDVEASTTFEQKVRETDAYWRWRLAPSARAWDEIRSDGLDHLTRVLGPAEEVRDRVGRPFPEILISRHRAGASDFWVTATTGLSGARMAGVERYFDDPAAVSRIELAFADDTPSSRGFDVLARLAVIPFGRCTWLGERHVVGDDANPFPGLGEDRVAILLTADPPGRHPDLSGAERRGDPVRYLWAVPIDVQALEVARARGASTLLETMSDRSAADATR